MYDLLVLGGCGCTILLEQRVFFNIHSVDVLLWGLCKPVYYVKSLPREAGPGFALY